MAIRIKTFGKLTEIIDAGDLQLQDVPDTDALKELLFQQFPVLANMKFFIAINSKMVRVNTAIATDAEVALLPPFSGG